MSAKAKAYGSCSWSAIGLDRPLAPAVPGQPRVVGVFKGEGVGPEVIDATLRVLAAVSSVSSIPFEVRRGGPIGRHAEALHGATFGEDVAAFCEQVFRDGGALLSGPGGGRYVYDLRRRFDLFWKLNPLVVPDALRDAGRLKREHVRGVDVLIVRENSAGIYQGEWSEAGVPGAREARHAFGYREDEVRRVLRVGARIARRRSGRMEVVWKEAGIPAVSRLWRACAEDIAREHGVACAFMDIDYAAYRLVQHARDLDVVVAPNLFGDVLSDLGGVLLGSRGLCCSGNFSACGRAVFQTNHGAAYDLAGTDRANPGGQVLSLALMLRESFGLFEEAALVEAALADVWRRGFRTADIAEEGSRVVGTREMGDLCADAIGRLAEPLRVL